jgi:hypothetical protein
MHGFVNETNNFTNYPSIRGGNQGGGGHYDNEN